MVPNLYEAVGGREVCRRLSVAFYARVESNPLLRPLFPGKSFTCAIEEFAAFLAQFLGGPGEDMQRRWWLSLRESHRRFAIGQRERDAWIAIMASALEDVQIEEPMRSRLLGFFERSSAHIVNQGEAVAPAERRSQARFHGSRPELSQRWEAQIDLDEAVAAIRRRRRESRHRVGGRFGLEDLWPIGNVRFARVDGAKRTKHLA